MSSNYTRNHLYIGGEWILPSTDNKIEIICASTEERLGFVPEAGKLDIDKAVDAARSALNSAEWRDLSVQERSALLVEFSNCIAKRGADIANAVSLQNGMPVNLSSSFEAGFPVGLLQYYAAKIAEESEPDIRMSNFGKESRVEKIPVGVVAAIVPWNFPVTLAMSKIAPALAAGCTLVVKPSPGTVLDSYLLAEAAEEAGIPKGVINWVPADREVASYLVNHPGVNKVAFTGSTEVGRKVAADCGRLLRPVSLELGGKSAAILLDDVDLDKYLESMSAVSLLNNGQTCFSCTRILIPKAVYEKSVRTIAEYMKTLKVGDPLNEATMIGPLASAEHRNRVEKYIEIGKAEGKVVVGAERPKNHKRGWYVEPTLFSEVNSKSNICQEEIFGPVLVAIPYSGDDEAVQIANDSKYGLGGSVWSSSTSRAESVASRIETGTIGINGYVPAIGSPFGGVKNSGIGTELGPEALAAYQRYKTTYYIG
ncbi:MAG: geranial dehydrogenase [Zhongshania marina]|jgi:acyl-CoA reductase-like NAD-dependent aldehyde dehydrogenase